MDPLFNHGKKRIADSKISNRDAKKISGELGFNRSSERYEFEKALHGPVTREKIHDKLQEMIVEGKITEEKAKSVVSQLGIERKDLRNFRDISENKAMRTSETPKDGGKSAVTKQSVGKNNNVNSKKTEYSDTKKSIYSLLNK